MSRQTAKSRPVIEFASILGLVLLFVFVEVQYGLFEQSAVAVAQTVPGLQTYSIALVGGAWIGLCIYSFRRRFELRGEVKARRTVEESFALHRISDPVTGLPNRRGFELVLDKRLAEGVSGAFSMVGIEICNLDTITSVHGSDVAQRVVVAFAERLLVLAGEDDFVARGDASVLYVMVYGEEIDEHRFRVDSMIEAIAAFGGGGIPVSDLSLQAYVTFGVMHLHEHLYQPAANNAEAILRRIEFALHRARGRGHETVETFDEKMENALRQRALVETSLNEAIRDGQIVPHFQPFIDLSSNRVTGLEVLARWAHPTEGQIPPDVFIPIAEDMGALRMLTLSILRQACEAALHWPSDIKLAINISPTDLRDSTMMDRFVEILRETGINADRIEIEITENAFVEEAGAIADAITKVKKEGVSVSIDDFGTGYSSLHHLRILPFDKIKIDQSFIKDMATNPDSKTIVKAVIALGTSLGLPTTAEGIEAGDNRDALLDLGCTIGQGYLFAKPLPASDITAFLNGYAKQIEKSAEVA
jgi:predicted signal transduction protein with EAL and GGDEF domain